MATSRMALEPDEDDEGDRGDDGDDPLVHRPHRRRRLVFFVLRDLPATLKAIAMACFWGRPSCMRVRMLLEMVLRLEPFLSGMATSASRSASCRSRRPPSCRR